MESKYQKTKALREKFHIYFTKMGPIQSYIPILIKQQNCWNM